MKKLIPALILTLVFSSAFGAKPWNLAHEEVASFQAKVVDVLCELTGECADKCGGGKHQLGLLKEDGTLYLATKANINFAGAVNDLIIYCNQSVEVDGLLIKNPLMTMYFVQQTRPVGLDIWISANKFRVDWNAANPDQAKLKKPWFRKDPLVKEIVEADGVFGIPDLNP